MKLSCPYCNHAFEAAPAARVTCPRCEDAFPVRGGPAPVHSIWSREAAQAVDLAGVLKQRLKQAAIVLLLIFLVIAGIVFWKIREQQKFVPPDPLPPPTAGVTPPLELRGLGYLPPNCNLVFAVQPGPLLVYAEKTRQDPVELLTKNRIPASALGALAKAGITLQQIDHIIGGFLIPELNEEPRICLVLVLRMPLVDEAKFLEQLHAKEGEWENRFEVKFDNLPMKLAKSSPTTWVFGFTEKDLVNAADGAEMSPSCRELIQEWVPRDAAVWAAADTARWSEKPILKLLKKEWLPFLAKGRAATVSLSFADEAKLRVAVRCVDTDASDKLFAYFKGKATGERSLANRVGEWTNLEVVADPKDIFTTVKGFLDDAAR